MTDTGFDLKSGDAVSGVRVQLSARPTVLTGTLDVSLENVGDSTLVAISTDPAKWSVPSARYLATAHADQSGMFIVRGLPEGTYYIVALPMNHAAGWSDPEELRRLSVSASVVTLHERETATARPRIMT